MRIFQIFCLVAVSSCGELDVQQAATFRPDVSGQSFTYSNFSDAIYAADDLESEALRIAELEKRLEANNFCVNGYEIVNRQVVTDIEGVFGDVSTIYYDGKCI